MAIWKSSITGTCNHSGKHRFQRGVFAMGRQVDIDSYTVRTHETTETDCDQHQSASPERAGSLGGVTEMPEDLVLENRFLPFHGSTCRMMNHPWHIAGTWRARDDDADMHVRGVL